MGKPQAGSAERDARDLNRGLAANLVGYVLKLAQPAMLVWVVRVYGADAWGQYTVSEAALLVALRVVLIGFDKTLLWWVPRMDRDGGSLAHLRGALYGTIALAAVGALLVGTLLAGPLASWRGASEAAAALQWMAWSLVPMTAMELFISAALGKRRVESQVLIRDALVSLSFVVLALVFFYAGFSVHGLSLAHFASNTLGAIASGIVFVNLYGRAGLIGAPKRPPAEVLKYSLPAWGTELISSLSQRLDVFAVSYWCTPAATGVYGVVVRVGNAVRSVRRSYDPIVITIMSDIAASGDRVRLRAAFSRATALVMLTQTPIFAGLALFADELAPLFGAGFEQAVLPILVICGFWLLNGAFGLNGLVVSGFGRSDLILIDLAISTFVLAVLLVALVPSYGPLGASIGLGLTYLITNLIQVVQAHRLSGVNPYDRSVTRAAIASTSALAAGGLALYLTLGMPRFASQLISAACFALVLAAFKPHQLLFKPSAG